MLIGQSHNSEGTKVVLEAMDVFKMSTQERVRFHSLIDALYSVDVTFLLKRDIMFFINTAITTVGSLEERLEIRADLIYGGIIPVLETLRLFCEDELCNADDEITSTSIDVIQGLQNQLQIFELCLQTDTSECVTDLQVFIF